MRILPVALYSYYKKLSDKEIIKLTNEISSLTHKHEISKLGCYIYIRYIMFLLDGQNKEEAYDSIKKIDYSSYSDYAISKYDRILKDDIINYKMDDISSSGYVVDTLECALWILLNAKSYKETIIATTNIGNDTDTIGAVAGSIAGIIYGYEAIPKEWLDKLMRKDYLIELALDFEKNIIEYKKEFSI
jgi:ADP-ribosylglycohydrolase